MLPIQFYFVLFVLLYIPTAIISSKTLTTFHIPEKLSGFDDFWAEDEGSIEKEPNHGYNKSNTAFKFTQLFDPHYHGQYHSEVVIKKAYKAGDTMYYATAFKLPSNWQYTKQMFTLMQFVAEFNHWTEGLTSCDGWTPSTTVWIFAQALYIRNRFGTVCKDDTQKHVVTKRVTRDEWHTLVLGVTWEEGMAGSLNVWYDGKKVLAKEQVPTTMAAGGKEFEMRVGLYCADWHNQKKIVGTQKKRHVLHDKIAVGPTYQSVDPALW